MAQRAGASRVRNPSESLGSISVAVLAATIIGFRDPSVANVLSVAHAGQKLTLWANDGAAVRGARAGSASLGPIVISYHTV